MRVSFSSLTAGSMSGKEAADAPAWEVEGPATAPAWEGPGVAEVETEVAVAAWWSGSEPGGYCSSGKHLVWDKNWDLICIISGSHQWKAGNSPSTSTSPQANPSKSSSTEPSSHTVKDILPEKHKNNIQAMSLTILSKSYSWANWSDRSPGNLAIYRTSTAQSPLIRNKIGEKQRTYMFLNSETLQPKQQEDQGRVTSFYASLCVLHKSLQ